MVHHLYSRVQNLVSRNYHSVVWCKVYFDTLNRLSVNHQCDRQIQGRTDGRTDILTANKAPYCLVSCPKTTFITDKY